MQLGFENKKQTMWAAVLGVIAVLAIAYEFIPMFIGSSTPGSNAQAAAPVVTTTRTTAATDVKAVDPSYQRPTIPPPPPIPLKFYGFASSPGERKKIFLKQGEDVFVAGEGEIVNRRYKVIRISPTSVEIQDLVNSGPPQNIPLTQG